MRYRLDKIYTSIGHAIMIAVNPYRTLDIYGEDTKSIYTGKSVEQFDNTEPHLYKMGEISFAAMINLSANQSMIISGESGAGKTESMKYVLEYLANAHQPKEAVASQDDIQNKILCTNPV
jgi:myosin heavy subunit